MKNIFHVALVILLACGMDGCRSLPSSGEFFLVNPVGTKLGPYEFMHGSTIGIAGTNYTMFIPSVVKEQNELVQKMRKIIIPEVEFRTMNINDIIVFFETCTIEFNPSRKPLAINMLQVGKSIYADPEVNSVITFSARNISLCDAMDRVCEIAGLRWDVLNNTVTFRKNVQPTSSGDSSTRGTGLGTPDK